MIEIGGLDRLDRDRPDRVRRWKLRVGHLCGANQVYMKKSIASIETT
jgi:hypothetical protein